MSVRMINEDLDPKKQTNFYDGQQLNVEDLEQLQIFLNKKIEDSTRYLGFDGRTSIEGLAVNPDTIMAEPFEFPEVPQSGTNPELENFKEFPEDPLDTAPVQFYQVFQAETDNIQRFDLKLQLVEGAGTSTVLVELRELTVPSNPQSSLKETNLYARQFQPDELPSTATDGLLSVDVSDRNDKQGISLTPGSYYAILVQFIRGTDSLDKIRIFHSNQSETSDLSSTLAAWWFVNGNFQQGLFNENAELLSLHIWHKTHTAAVRVEAGSAYVNGERIIVDEAQRFLSLVDRQNTTLTEEHPNYVAIRFVLDSTDPELHPRTGNSVDSNYEDTFEIQVFNQIGWDAEQAKDDFDWLLLAVATDRNIVPFSVTQTFELDARTNLAYNDWLNPCIKTPSLPALQIQASRPDDFIFYIDNVPGEVPLLDDDGNQVFDELGQPLVDTISRVLLILYLDGGINQRRFEMALNTTTSTTPPFSSYFITITDPEGDLIPGLANFAFDKNELTPNTFYNYVAVTARGRSVFVQDFNIQIRTPDPSTGILSLTRERLFEVRLTNGDISAVINEDLRLGDPIAPFGNVGQKVVGFDSVIQNGEGLGKNGTPASETITPVTDTLVEVPGSLADSFKFEPLPMSFENGDLIVATEDSVSTAVEADAIVIKVDGISVAWSGTEGPERGGTGAPHTVEGRVLFSDDPVERLAQMQALATSLGFTGSQFPTDADDFDKFVGLQVTARDNTGRDNSQQGLVAVTQLDGTDLVYRVIAMGRGADNAAGFLTGEKGNIYFENRLARDIVGVPLEFTYAPFGTSIVDIRQIDTQEQWFGERAIVYAPDVTTFRARPTADEEIGIDPIGGQVFWNEHDQELIFDQLGLVATIEYFHLDQRFEVINFYQSRLFPWGTANDCPILNQDVSIQQAVTSGDIVLLVNGLAELNGDPNFLTNPANYVAMHPGQPGLDQSLLPPDKISINPELGRVVFGVDIAPDPDDEVTLTYYYLKAVTTCATNAFGVTYDPTFDFNLDGRVDESDLNQFLAAFGSSTGDPNFNSVFDFNNDGDIDNADWEEFLQHFGTVQAGEPSAVDATEARLGSILVFRTDNPLRQLEVVRAVSFNPTTSFPLGRTVLFFSGDQPVSKTADYTILFGFATALVTGINSVDITTSDMLSQVTKDVIDFFNVADPTETREIIDVLSAERTENGAIVYDNTLTFSPSITETGTHTVRAIWDTEGLAVTNREELVSSAQYEHKFRRRFGPFKMAFTGTDFESDGSALTIRFSANPEATLADGSPDPTGLHLNGIPITDMRFAILLTVTTPDNTTEVWRWHNFVPTAEDNGIKLQFNEFLALGSRFRGKGGVSVLTPFGTGENQVDLRPKFAGGDIENDLSNIIVLRDDFISNTPPIHNHTSDEQGGQLTSENIDFEDPEARFNEGNVTEVVYELDDNLRQQLNALTSQLVDLQLNANNVIYNDTSGCFGVPSGNLTVADAIQRILNFIAWDELNDCGT